METGITFTFAAIFLGAAVLSSIALYAKQPIIIAYIALGVALGPYGLGVVSDMELVSGAGHVGIILLLFLLGLDMKPVALWNSLRQSTLVALISAVVFASTGYGLSLVFGFNGWDAILISAALVFSSTIIGIKLLPTTVLHHRHLGELMIALLLFQDLLAIVVLVMMESVSAEDLSVLGPTLFCHRMQRAPGAGDVEKIYREDSKKPMERLIQQSLQSSADF